jgi:hypothetical protein
MPTLDLLAAGASTLFKKVGSKLGARAIPFLGTALIATDALKAVVDKAGEDVRDEAREQLQCKHVDLVPYEIGDTPVSARINYVKNMHGMSFVYGGVALCHPQTSFDVGKVSTDVLRWDGAVVTSRPANVHIQPCFLCKANG